MIIGYIRINAGKQLVEYAQQERDLKDAGVEQIFSEQVSSVSKRAILKECLAVLKPGDTLVVTKPDRLARSITELLNIELALAKRGIGLVVIGIGAERLDTRLIASKATLAILAGVVVWEKEIIIEGLNKITTRMKETRGKLRGRPISIDSDEILNLSLTMGVTKVSRTLGISRATVYRIIENSKQRCLNTEVKENPII